MLRHNVSVTISRLIILISLIYFQSSFADESITPIPDQLDIDWNKVDLGDRLFNDTRFSADGSVSCATCHPLDKGGADGLPNAVGIKKRIGSFNTPTVLNSSLNFAQFWNGRAESLEDQIDGPITNHAEMDSNWPDIIQRLSTDAQYVKDFNTLYSSPIDANSIKDAIATFERSLLTPNSAFDRYLKGDVSALTDKEIEGFNLFKAYGCSSCHQGVAIGGNMYEKIGVFEDYYSTKTNLSQSDDGRFSITGIEEHRFEFKVPSLRNVALTAPYFHNGEVATLNEAIFIMGKYQLGRKIPADDIKKISAFLHSLTGKRISRP